MYELFCGDIFDMKCDLLVVPCNNYGGISTNVCISLRNNNIPYDLKKNECRGCGFSYKYKTLYKCLGCCICGFC